MNKELMEALDILEKEKEISKETLFDAIENSLIGDTSKFLGLDFHMNNIAKLRPSGNL